MDITEDRLKLVLEKVANNLNLKQWTYYKRQKDKTIENYFAILVPVTLVGIDNEREIEKAVFIKLSPTYLNDQIKDTIREVFKVEEYTYRYLLPSYKRISNVNVDLFLSECYYTNLELNNEVIVLKDMRNDGFKGYDKEGFLDKEHVLLSLEALATFHALSIIYKKKDGNFDNMIMKPFTEKHIEPYYCFIKSTLQSHINLFNGTIYEGYLNRLLLNLANFVIYSTADAKCLVYGHGDFWKENILFKYENSKPIQACLIDFQLSRKMSPAHDILILFLTSVGICDIRQHHEYLNVYLDTFQRILNENGFDDTYSADDLKHDMKIVAPYCIAIAIMTFSLWFGLEDGDVVKSKNVTKKYHEQSQMLKKLVINILEELNTFGYIQL